MFSTRIYSQPNAEPAIVDLLKAGYQHRYVTPIESDTFPPGLNEDIIRNISVKKKEPDRELNWRLKTYQRRLNLEDPEWAQRYHYIIELGENLPSMTEQFMTEQNHVLGCMNIVYVSTYCDIQEPQLIQFHGYCDTSIIRGVVALMKEQGHNLDTLSRDVA